MCAFTGAGHHQSQIGRFWSTRRPIPGFARDWLRGRHIGAAWHVFTRSGATLGPEGPNSLRVAQLGVRGKASRVQAIDNEADDGSDREGERRPHVKAIDREADEKAAEQWTDDRANAPEPQLPAGAVGA